MIDHYTKLLAAFEENSMDHLASYFHDNAEKIDTLIKLYEAYNRYVMNAQAKRIRGIKKVISNITADRHWSDMEGLELTYNHFDPPLHIRGSFTSTAKDPLGTFCINILAPTMQAWNYYEDQLLSHYTHQEPLILGNKTILPVVTIPGRQTQQVLTALQEVHSFLSSLTPKTFLHPLTSH